MKEDSLNVKQIVLHLLLTGGSICALCVDSFPIQYCHCLHNLGSVQLLSDLSQQIWIP
jgi:hypothetical protein